MEFFKKNEKLILLIVPILIFFITPYWSSMHSGVKKIEYFVSSEKVVFNSDFIKKLFFGSEVYYKGNTVDKVFYTVIMIENSGSVDIKAEDYDGPIAIKYNDNTEVYMVELVASNPHELPVKVSNSKGAIIIKPLLLNSGDQFYLSVYSSDRLDVSHVAGRIQGVKKIESRPEVNSGVFVSYNKKGDYVGSYYSNNLFKVSVFLCLFMSVFGAFIANFFYNQVSKDKSYFENTLFVIIMFSGYLVLILSIRLTMYSLFSEFSFISYFLLAFSSIFIGWLINASLQGKSKKLINS